MDGEYFKKILNLKNSNHHDTKHKIELHVNVTKLQNKYETKKINSDISNNIKMFLKQNTKKISKHQEKLIYHKNIVRKETTNMSDKQLNMCQRESLDYEMINEDMILLSKINLIEEINFPLLENYDRIYEYEIEIYYFKNFNIVFKTQEEKKILYFDLSNIKEDNYDELRNMYKFIKKQIN